MPRRRPSRRPRGGRPGRAGPPPRARGPRRPRRRRRWRPGRPVRPGRSPSSRPPCSRRPHRRRAPGPARSSPDRRRARARWPRRFLRPGRAGCRCRRPPRSRRPRRPGRPEPGAGCPSPYGRCRPWRRPRRSPAASGNDVEPVGGGDGEFGVAAGDHAQVGDDAPAEPLAAGALAEGVDRAGDLAPGDRRQTGSGWGPRSRRERSAVSIRGPRPRRRRSGPGRDRACGVLGLLVGSGWRPGRTRGDGWRARSAPWGETGHGAGGRTGVRTAHCRPQPGLRSTASRQDSRLGHLVLLLGEMAVGSEVGELWRSSVDRAPGRGVRTGRMPPTARRGVADVLLEGRVRLLDSATGPAGPCSCRGRSHRPARRGRAGR